MRVGVAWLLLIGGCGAFGADPSPSADAGAPSATSSSSSSSSGGVTPTEDGGTSDGGGTPDGGAPLAVPVGLGCAERQPVPNVCLDFEQATPGSTPNPNNKNSYSSLLVNVGGSSSERSLYANAVIQGDGAWSYAEVRHNGQAQHRVAWAFDIKLTTMLSKDTEMFEFHQPSPTDADCMLQPHFHEGRIHVNEACDNSIVGEQQLVTIDQAADGSWVNVLVDADFDLRTIRLTVTRANGTSESKLGRFSRTTLTPDSYVKVGVTWTSKENGSALLNTDNVALYWK